MEKFAYYIYLSMKIEYRRRMETIPSPDGGGGDDDDGGRTAGVVLSEKMWSSYLKLQLGVRTLAQTRSIRVITTFWKKSDSLI
jgi:hypothetical protein